MAGIESLITVIAGVLIVCSSLVAGYRLHLFVERRTRLRLPIDAGAACGLAFGLVSVWMAL
jgi:site-specific recombinase